MTGKCGGSSHAKSILKTRQTFSRYLPIAFHNLRNFYEHLLFTGSYKQKKDEF